MIIYDSAHYKAQLKKNNVKVISATESISEDASGILLESLLEGFAEYYSADLAEKVRRGMTENALKCKFNGGSLLLGYKIDENRYYQLGPVTAPIVNDLFKKYADGENIKELVDYLKQLDVKNSRGKHLGIESVKLILKNPRYTGK